MGCSGTNAYKSGTTKIWVFSLTIALLDDTAIETRQSPIKSSAGYDLTGLFVGCERILSLATEAVLRIIVLPRTSRVAIALFPIIDEAAQCIDKAAQKGVHVAAVEFLNDMAMKCINESGATDREWLETATLFFKFIGTELGVKEESQVSSLRKTSWRQKAFVRLAQLCCGEDRR